MICKFSNNETDQCLDVHQDCKHCDHSLDIFLREMGVDLFEWQRVFLKQCIKQDRPIYIIPKRYRDHTYFGGLELMRDILLKGE